MYADESGSSTLEGEPDPGFPLFVLAMMLVEKQAYSAAIVPSLQALKFKYVGHDQLILHEREIRRQKGTFAFLQADPANRAAFLADLDTIVADADMRIYAAVIDKPKLKAKYATPFSPYEIALYFVMERLLNRLVSTGQAGRLVHVVFECRGKKEDQELELAFRKIAANQFNWGYKNPDFKQLDWEPRFVDKKCNSSGLQLADLVARPIGLHSLRPAQLNHAYDVLSAKLGEVKVFP